MIEDAEFSVETTRLDPGDRILVYTDGVTEASNRSGQYFETKRLEQLLRANPGRSCAELITALTNAVETFTEGMPQSDDITAVVLEYEPEA